MTPISPISTGKPGLGGGVLQGNDEISLDRLAEYPDLARAHAVWRDKVQRDGKARLDPADLPRHLLQTVMVIEVQPDFRDARVRLAGTRICEMHGRDLRDETVRHFFKPGDAEVILASMRKTIDTFTPSLARRACVSISDDRWDFVRLLLPERDGQNGHRLFEVIDRATLKRLPGPW